MGFYKMKREIIILLGIQGSGKGRLGEGLRAARDYLFIETGAIFRSLDKNNPVDAEVIKIMEAGELVPSEKVNELVEARLTTDRDILLDGFPRKNAQAEFLIDWARKNNFKIKAVQLNIPDEMVIARINNRVVVDGSRRPDDLDQGSIAKRVAQYHEKTMPMIEFLRAHPDVEFIDIDGTQTIPEVFEDTAKRLGLK